MVIGAALILAVFALLLLAFCVLDELSGGAVSRLLGPASSDESDLFDLTAAQRARLHRLHRDVQRLRERL